MKLDGCNLQDCSCVQFDRSSAFPKTREKPIASLCPFPSQWRRRRRWRWRCAARAAARRWRWKTGPPTSHARAAAPRSTSPRSSCRSRRRARAAPSLCRRRPGAPLRRRKTACRAAVVVPLSPRRRVSEASPAQSAASPADAPRAAPQRLVSQWRSHCLQSLRYFGLLLEHFLRSH